MKFITQSLKHITLKQVAICVGVFCVYGVLWFLLPKLGMTSLVSRLLLLFFLTTCVLLSMAVTAFWAKQKGQAVYNAISQERTGLAGRQLEVEQLKAQMAEAIKTLKTSELGIQYRGSAALYALPWYVLIGPSSAGKSTLLRGSGMDFPHRVSSPGTDPMGIEGVAGTHNCDWWFSNQAIILDTAGRYTSESTTHDEWFEFLHILKKGRRRLPLNGVIVAISMVNVSTFTDEGLEGEVVRIRARIEELYSELGFVLPVYLVLTQCDLIDGFDEFFKEMSPKEQNQPWGIDLLTACDFEAQLESFNAQLEAMYTKLTALRLGRMHLEQEAANKVKIYDFPEQFRSCGYRVRRLFEALINQNMYQESPRFCGVYFTSGTQGEGHYLQRDIAKPNGNPLIARLNQWLKGKRVTRGSFFVKDLFEQVIFKNKYFARRGLRRAIFQRWLKSASIVASLVIVLTAFLLYSSSLSTNDKILKNGVQKALTLVDTMQNRSVSQQEKLTATAEATDYLNELLAYKNNIPLHLRLGLYRGDALRPFFETVLHDALYYQFFKPVSRSLLKQLISYQRQWQQAGSAQRVTLRGGYYSSLKAYLMLAFPNNMELDFATNFLSQHWHQILSAKKSEEDEAQWKKLTGMVAFYLTKLKADPIIKNNQSALIVNMALVRRARRQLYTSTNANNLYAQIRDRGTKELGSKKINQIVRDYGADLLYSDSSLPRLYTLEGWKSYVLPQLKKAVDTVGGGDWVIDTPLYKIGKSQGAKAQLRPELAARYYKAITELYFSEYARAWLRFLASVRVQRFGSLSDATEQYRILYSPEGPISQLLLSVKLNMLVLADMKTHRLSSHVTRLFDALAQISGVKGSLLPNFFKELTAVQSDIERLAMSPDLSRDAKAYAKRLLNGSGNDTALYRSSIALDKLLEGIVSSEARKTIKPLLVSPLREAWREIIHEATRGLQRQWEEQVYSYYLESIAAKFPFSLSGEDAAISDVGDFFKPKDGVLWDFVDRQLKPFLNTSSRQWTSRQWLGLGAPFTAKFLHSMVIAKRLSQGLYHQHDLRFEFSLFPYPTTGIREILFEANGQLLRYRNGPQEWARFSWPGHMPNESTLLRTAALKPYRGSMLEYNSVWGMFHLLSKAKWRQVSQSVIEAEWQFKQGVKPYVVRLRLQGEGRNKAFNLLATRQLSLPKSVFIESIDDLT